MKLSSALVTCALPFALIACGGGGGGGSGASSTTSSVGPTAEGAYSGTLSGGTANTGFQLLVLEDGTYWAIYGTQTSNAFAVSGFLQGQGTSNNGSFVSSNGRDFGVSPSISGNVKASFVADKSISGTVAYANSSSTFSGTAIPSTTYAYNSGASVAAISGAWTLNLLTGEHASVNISNTGVIGGITNLGCAFTGSVAPRQSGKNVFDVSLTFGAAPCVLANQTVSGIGVSYPIQSTSQTQLMVALVDSSRAYGTAGFGVR